MCTTNYQKVILELNCLTTMINISTINWKRRFLYLFFLKTQYNYILLYLGENWLTNTIDLVEYYAKDKQYYYIVQYIGTYNIKIPSDTFENIVYFCTYIVSFSTYKNHYGCTNTSIVRQIFVNLLIFFFYFCSTMRVSLKFFIGALHNLNNNNSYVIKYMIMWVKAQEDVTPSFVVSVLHTPLANSLIFNIRVNTFH